MKTLILTEKPSVARDFAAGLGVTGKRNGHFENSEYIITYAIGHLLTPYNPDDYSKDLKRWSYHSLPIIPKKFKYKTVKSTSAQFAVVKKLLKRDDIEKVIIATDAGREGELIGRTILYKAKFSGQVYRFWTSQALTPSVIRDELKKISPIKQYNTLYYAGLARQRADWLVGMNLSRAATLSMGELYSIGRVQTAVLAMIVARRKEIDLFVPTPFWNIVGEFNFNGADLTGNWIDQKSFNSKIETADSAKMIIAKVTGKSSKVIKKTSKKQIVSPPELFSLTELQREANRKYNLSAKKTLDLTQALYEKHKCISYPRSDSTVLGTTSLDLTKKILKKLKTHSPSYFEKFDLNKISLKNRRVFNDSKLTDHHAIIPLKEPPRNLTGSEEQIYKLIMKRFIMAFSIDSIKYDDLITVEVESEIFRATGTRVEEEGFTFLDRKITEKFIPLIPEGTTGTLKKATIKERATTPPLEYSENTLLRDMINPSRLVKNRDLKKIFSGEVGLGTQSTRANIIETLLARDYISRGKKQLIAIRKGITLINRLNSMKVSQLLSRPEETAKWEMKLAKIATGESPPKEFVNSVETYVKDAVNEWRESI